jgi:hypothetical protein
LEKPQTVHEYSVLRFSKEGNRRGRGGALGSPATFTYFHKKVYSPLAYTVGTKNYTNLFISKLNIL